MRSTNKCWSVCRQVWPVFYAARVDNHWLVLWSTYVGLRTDICAFELTTYDPPECFKRYPSTARFMVTLSFAQGEDIWETLPLTGWADRQVAP